MTAALLVTALVSGGLFLLLQRGWVRRTLGFVLLSHAVNVLLLAAGRGAGREVPFAGGPGPQADPLPQAFALTAVVISFAVTAFLLVLAYRIDADRRDQTEDER